MPKRPPMNLLHHGTGALLSNPQSLIGRLVFDLAFDAVELGDELERFFALLREALFDLDKLSSGVRPAVRELEIVPTLLERLVRAVAVAHHRACEILQEAAPPPRHRGSDEADRITASGALSAHTCQRLVFVTPFFPISRHVVSSAPTTGWLSTCACSAS